MDCAWQNDRTGFANEGTVHTAVREVLLRSSWRQQLCPFKRRFILFLFYFCGSVVTYDGTFSALKGHSILEEMAVAS